MLNLENYSPRTLYGAVGIIVNNLDESEWKLIKDQGVSWTHFSFGMALRNAWGLWQDSELAQYFKKEFGLTHADDMSGLILLGVECAVQRKAFDPWAEAEKYKQHWREMEAAMPESGGQSGTPDGGALSDTDIQRLKEWRDDHHARVDQINPDDPEGEIATWLQRCIDALEQYGTLQDAYAAAIQRLQDLGEKTVPLEPCDHDWVDATNEVIESGYWCRKCNAVRAVTPGD